MDKYLKNNYSFWQYGYTAPNVENVILDYTVSSKI